MSEMIMSYNSLLILIAIQVSIISSKNHMGVKRRDRKIKMRVREKERKR